MRAEGVLRLILNVSLYVGMTCMEDGKHVRMTVFENGEKRFVTFRVSFTHINLLLIIRREMLMVDWISEKCVGDVHCDP
jgi:hypothetical protein